jgi:hypothetical protein
MGDGSYSEIAKITYELHTALGANYLDQVLERKSAVFGGLK